MSIALAILTLIGLLFSAMALTDIYHGGEQNLDLEWCVVRMSFFFTLMFVAISSVTILRLGLRQ